MGLDQHSYTQLQSSLRKVNEALRESAVTPTL
jgi:hypothetical protein